MVCTSSVISGEASITYQTANSTIRRKQRRGGFEGGSERETQMAEACAELLDMFLNKHKSKQCDVQWVHCAEK